MPNSANEIVKKRGGPKSVMEDASELAEIAKREGSMADKAKAAGQALKEPGTHHQTPPAQPDEQTQSQQGVARDESR